MIGIYKITNKINGKSYIGQSIHIEERWKEHLYRNSSHTSLIKLALQKYGANNFTFEVIEECNQEELDKKEIYWIKYFDTYNNGYNLTLGGSQGFKFDIDKVYDEYKKTDNITQTAKNIGCSINTARRILHEYGITKFDCQIEKKIESVDPKTLLVVKRYDSIQDAADDMKVDRTAISYAVNGYHKSAAGYFWKYQDKKKNFKSEKIKNWKEKVCQIDKKTDKILNTFESAADAAAYLGKDRKNGGSMIISVCNGRKKTAYNYKWKKLNETAE